MADDDAHENAHESANAPWYRKLFGAIEDVGASAVKGARDVASATKRDVASGRVKVVIGLLAGAWLLSRRRRGGRARARRRPRGLLT